LTAALTAAGDSGAEAAFLEVAEDDLRARPLSQRFGFREVGRRRAYYPPGGRGELSGDALIMRRDF
jgi:ribosomal-protein-alanine N-acetyltransferase